MVINKSIVRDKLPTRPERRLHGGDEMDGYTRVEDLLV